MADYMNRLLSGTASEAAASLFADASDREFGTALVAARRLARNEGECADLDCLILGLMAKRAAEAACRAPIW